MHPLGPGLRGRGGCCRGRARRGAWYLQGDGIGGGRGIGGGGGACGDGVDGEVARLNETAERGEGDCAGVGGERGGGGDACGEAVRVGEGGGGEWRSRGGGGGR